LVGRTVPGRTSLPILECILFKAEEGVGITLYASDTEMCINTAPIPADIEVSGAVALNARLFTDIIRKMPGDYVQLETDEKLMTLCKSGQAKLEISGLPADEFPLVDEEELVGAKDNYVLKSQTLKDMIRQTIFSVSIDPSKVILTGELLEIVDNSLRVVAVDMFRISYREVDLPEGTNDASVVVPAKALNELSRAISGDNEEEISFYFTDKRAFFQTDQFTMSARLLEGEFIRYNQIFNQDFSSSMVINRTQMLNSLERSVLVAMENRQISITLDIRDDLLVITSRSDKGHTYDEIACETDGTDMTIYFNPRYLLDALRAIEDESVIIKFNTPRSPCTIQSVTDATQTKYKYLIVPLRSPN
ncbi:MAG: DNA polymerase III subunit beta, partial [Defluviitaleaceae bacterium]|nr:DNA polymerase III subunit beta [Defluviitaleaceae bacterium]